MRATLICLPHPLTWSLAKKIPYAAAADAVSASIVEATGMMFVTHCPSFLGYVMQQHNIRSNASGMTRGWQIFGNRLESAIQEYIVDLLAPLGQVRANQTNSFDLGKIPNLHSLIPYSLEARKPVFECTGSDGLTGAHIQRDRDSKVLFTPIANAIQSVIP